MEDGKGGNKMHQATRDERPVSRVTHEELQNVLGRPDSFEAKLDKLTEVVTSSPALSEATIRRIRQSARDNMYSHGLPDHS